MTPRNISRSLFLAILVLLTLGCSIPGIVGSQGIIDEGAIKTSAVQTIEATLTIGALMESLNKPTLTSTPLPVNNEPSATPQSTATNTMIVLTLENTLTPTPTPSPTLALTPTIPMIHSTKNTNCRSGPDSIYEVVGFLLVGERVEVHGRNSNSSWWYIQNPDDPQHNCWVWSQTTVVEGNLSIIPVVTPVPTNTPGVPEFTITSKVVPEVYTGPCPVNIELSAKVSTNLPVTIGYSWVASFGYPFPDEEFTFDVAGKQSFTETMVISSTTAGNVRFRITSPEFIKGDRINIVVTCLP